jgi:hypothetical protein
MRATSWCTSLVPDSAHLSGDMYVDMNAKNTQDEHGSTKECVRTFPAISSRNSVHEHCGKIQCHKHRPVLACFDLPNKVAREASHRWRAYISQHIYMPRVRRFMVTCGIPA